MAAKCFRVYLEIGVVWLASSVDSLSGYPPSLCLPFYPFILHHSKEPFQNQLFTLTPKCCSVSSKFTWAWVMKQHLQDGLSLFVTANYRLSNPLPSHWPFSALSLPESDMTHHSGVCILEELEITSTINMLQRPFAFGLVRCSPVLSLPATWSDRERLCCARNEGLCYLGVQDSGRRCFSSVDGWRENKSKKKVNLYYVFLLLFS